jgi:hypothetical protein
MRLDGKMKHHLKFALLTLVMPVWIYAADRSNATLDSLRTNVISRASVPEKGAFVELAQGGSWLSFSHSNNPSGWGLRLAEPQQSVFVTNGLAITLPDWRAYDLDLGNSRNLIRKFNPQDVIWGKASDGLAVGLKVDGSNVMDERMVQLEAYLRNTSDKPLRVFACPGAPSLLLPPKLQVIDPDGKVINGAKGKRSVQITSCSHSFESDWPVLQPGETLGPLHFTMFTSNELPTVFDLWFDGSRHGNYQVSLVYSPDRINPPEYLAQSWKDSPPVWQGKASSGTILLSKP